jgi:hypothetical protein
MKPAGGFGDCIFALKYAAELRRQIYLKTGVFEEVILVSDEGGVADIQQLKGDREYQIPLYTPATLREAILAGKRLSFVVDGPAADRPFLCTVSEAIEDLVAGQIPLDHVGEYQVASQDTYQGIDSEKVGVFDIMSRVDSGVPGGNSPKGLLLSPELFPLESASGQNDQKKVFLSDLEVKLKAKMIGGEGSAQDLALFEEYNAIGFQYAHEYPVTIQGPEGERALYPCEKFLKAYFAAVPDSSLEKKHQHIVLVGKGPAMGAQKTFQEDEKYESILNSLETIHAKGYSKIVFVDVEAGSEQVISDRGEGPTVTFYREKSLPHASIIALLGLSDAPVCGVTGDQSLSEGLSSSKIVIYELLQHKAELQSELTDLLTESLSGDQSFKKEIASRVDSHTMLERLQAEGILDEGREYNEEELEDIYVDLVTTQAIKCIQLIGSDSPEEEDLIQIGALMRLDGVVDLMRLAHGLIAQTGDLVSNNYETHAEKMPILPRDSESLLVGQFKFAVLTGNEQEALEIIKKIPLRAAFEVIGVDNAMCICQTKQLTELSTVLEERALSEPSGLADLLSEALKQPSINMFSSDKSDLYKQIINVSSVEELRGLESLSTVGFTPAMRESLPDNFPLSKIKAQLSSEARNAMTAQNDIAIKTDSLEEDEDSALDPLAIYSSKTYEQFQEDFSHDLQGRLLPVSLISEEDYNVLILKCEQKLMDFLEQRLLDCLTSPLSDSFVQVDSYPQLLDIESVNETHLEWLRLPEEKAEQLIPLVQRLSGLEKITDYVAKSPDPKIPLSNQKMLMMLRGVGAPEVAATKMEVSEYQSLTENLPRGYIKSSSGFIRIDEHNDKGGLSKGHYFELTPDEKSVKVTPVSIKRVRDKSQKYEAVVKAINQSKQETISEVVEDYLVLRVADGKALSKISVESLKQENRLSLVTCYLSELARVHDSGVLLCNIRPSNVIVDPLKMGVQFVELGDAIFYKEDAQSMQLSKLDESVFPIEGMPPESLSDCIPTSSMDIYASVPIMAELLGANMHALMYQKLEDTFAALRPEGEFEDAKGMTLAKFDRLGDFEDVCIFGIPGIESDEHLEQFFKVFTQTPYDFSKTGLSQEHQELLSRCQDNDPDSRPSAAHCIQMLSQPLIEERDPERDCPRI